MKNTFIYLVKAIVFSILIFSFSSCALKSITSDYDYKYSNLESISLENLGKGKILIYNNANFVHTIDNTGRLNVWIDDKPAGQIRSGEYIIVELNLGKHQMRLLHIDMVNMRSVHDVEIDENTKVIKVKATLSSNDLQVTNVLPENISKFKHAPKRR